VEDHESSEQDDDYPLRGRGNFYGSDADVDPDEDKIQDEDDQRGHRTEQFMMEVKVDGARSVTQGHMMELYHEDEFSLVAAKSKQPAKERTSAAAKQQVTEVKNSGLVCCNCCVALQFHGAR
jgi:hypothetical protein